MPLNDHQTVCLETFKVFSFEMISPVLYVVHFKYLKNELKSLKLIRNLEGGS